MENVPPLEREDVFADFVAVLEDRGIRRLPQPGQLRRLWRSATEETTGVVGVDAQSDRTHLIPQPRQVIVLRSRRQ